ncbi:hypothetical protein [Streptomyces sp. NPDC088752]|uniref:hypothetical protein n=1 Tax=Streptomyces sp. NPDC088752 TaxID=3154963 RepID=UPI00343016B3
MSYDESYDESPYESYDESLYDNLPAPSTSARLGFTGGRSVEPEAIHLAGHAISFAPPPERPFALSHMAEGVNEQIFFTEKKLDALREITRGAAEHIGELSNCVEKMTNSLHEPGTELGAAKEKIVHLETRVEALIKEAKRQKRRADTAESLVGEAEVVDMPFLRRTPGDAIRFLAQKILPLIEGNDPSLLGYVMALRIVADDVERMQQG